MQRPAALKHTTVRDYQRFVRPYLETAAQAPFTVVALMRAPQEWLGSWYRFYQKADHAEGPRCTRGLHFDDFVQGWCDDVPPPYADFGTQSEFLTPEAEQDGLDHLFRYADIGHFVHYLEDRLQCEIILPRVNVSPQAELTLCASTHRLMLRRAAADISLYNNISSPDAVNAARPAP